MPLNPHSGLIGVVLSIPGMNGGIVSVSASRARWFPGNLSGSQAIQCGQRSLRGPSQSRVPKFLPRASQRAGVVGSSCGRAFDLSLSFYASTAKAGHTTWGISSHAKNRRL
jgi:hypothetical protein